MAVRPWRGGRRRRRRDQLVGRGTEPPSRGGRHACRRGQPARPQRPSSARQIGPAGRRGRRASRVGQHCTGNTKGRHRSGRGHPGPASRPAVSHESSHPSGQPDPRHDRHRLRRTAGRIPRRQHGTSLRPTRATTHPRRVAPQRGHPQDTDPAGQALDRAERGDQGLRPRPDRPGHRHRTGAAHLAGRRRRHRRGVARLGRRQPGPARKRGNLRRIVRGCAAAGIVGTNSATPTEPGAGALISPLELAGQVRLFTASVRISQISFLPTPVHLPSGA